MQVIIVSDGERILGLRYFSANDRGISVEKLELYSTYDGIFQSAYLLIALDYGRDTY